MNITVLSGNLTRDVEIANPDSQSEWKILKFTIANNDEYRDGQSITSFVDCEVLTNKPQMLIARMVKGAGIQATGALRQDSWPDQSTGQKRSKIKLAVQNRPFPQIMFIAKKDEPIEVAKQDNDIPDDIPF